MSARCWSYRDPAEEKQMLSQPITRAAALLALALAVSAASPAASQAAPALHVGTPSVVNIVRGDGAASLERGEVATVALPMANDGDRTAQAVSVSLSLGDPYNSAVNAQVLHYKSIKAGAGKVKPCKVSLGRGCQNGMPLAIVADASYPGSPSPIESAPTVPTGE